ncbi:MAG: two-component regulator propeller domain-containing protein, partial [Mucinivorans sp.]
MKFKGVILYCVLIVQLSYGQNISQISNKEGLSNSSIISLSQDSNGFIWVGTCDGLNLWDGANVRHYTLSGNLIQEIIATDDGYLWIRTNYGLDRFDTRNDQVEQHTKFPRVHQFAARSRNEAFFLDQGSLYGYNAQTSTFVAMAPACPMLERATYLFYDKKGFVWALSPNEISYAQVTVCQTSHPVVGAWQS